MAPEPPAIEVVFLDVGGPIYDDAVYRTAVLRALRELGASVTDEEYEREYERCRRAQSGPFRRRLAERFLGPGADVEEVTRRAARHWRYPSEALLPDVRPCLERLAGRYRLGVIANQQRSVREAMRRDGIDRYIEVWGVSEDLGVQKPDPRIFAMALERAGAPPETTAMVGDRLDYDIRPARAAGMRTVWMLRGEAPEQPTAEQLAEADEAVRSMEELPAALDRLSGAPAGRSAS